MGSFFRRAAFALRFGDINPLISNFITGESKILYLRDLSERVRLLAPFLDFDADPYPVVVDGKRDDQRSTFAPANSGWSA